MVLWRLVILTSLKFFSEFKKAFYLQETRLHKRANSFIKAALNINRNRATPIPNQAPEQLQEVQEMNHTQSEAQIPPQGETMPGKIHVYTGHGKGKTTAALGLAFRAAGHGFRVHILHFMKNDPDYGEMRSAARMGPSWHVEQWGRSCFVNKDNPDRKDIDLARRGLERGRELVNAGGTDLLILDELVNALDFNLVAIEDVLSLLRDRDPRVEVVLTGRNAPAQLIDAADLVTEMRLIKHYYDTGTPARVGIES
jgi:cob(I)alamin adenosyltransferase